jgi:hypothetical protein
VSTATSAGTQTLEIEAGDAGKVARWLRHCGGVAVWGCQDLGDPSRTWLTPALHTDGTPSAKPHWSASDKPERVVTDPDRVEVVERREVKRLRVAVRRGYGLRFELTRASSQRLRAALEKVGDGATHAFEGDEAVVYAVERRAPLPAWLVENGHG